MPSMSSNIKVTLRCMYISVISFTWTWCSKVLFLSTVLLISFSFNLSSNGLPTDEKSVEIVISSIIYMYIVCYVSQILLLSNCFDIYIHLTKILHVICHFDYMGFVSSSIPSWKILTAHAQPFRVARDLAFCLKVPLDALLVWASSGGSGETARMRRLAWTIAARIGDKY